MWYYNAEIISSPTSMVINDLRYDSSVFRDKEKLKELGIKPYREVTPDMRYFDMGAISIDESGNEVVGTYASIGKDVDALKTQMLNQIKNGLTNNLLATDWYYLRKLRTDTDVPSEIQDYSDALYAEYDSKKTEINAMTKLSEVMEFESRPHKLVSKVRHINSDTGKHTWGPETETKTMNVNMCLNWSMSPDATTDPSFVSLTAD
jgi:hypothetical protein|tara:strand:+ start:2867 stop:3481 length:615 start_codon:yes stop_codon:yes gene_type:complete